MIARSGSVVPSGEILRGQVQRPASVSSPDRSEPLPRSTKGARAGLIALRPFPPYAAREHHHAIGFAGWVTALISRSSNAFCHVGRRTARVLKQEINSAESCRSEWVGGGAQTVLTHAVADIH